MRFQPLSLAALATLSTTVLATVPLWGQCGGQGFTGETVCANGNCVRSNNWFSQCLPVTTTSTKSTSSSSSSSSSSPSSVPTTTPITTPTTTTSRTSTSCGAFRARSTGPPIQAITTGSAVSGMSLQRDSSTGKGVLVTGLYGAALSTGSTIYRLEYAGSVSCLTRDYLNIHNATTSYKPIFWNYGQVLTTYWDPNSYPIIQTAATSPYGTKSQFLACQEEGKWIVYLQTGTDVPPGETCATTQLKVGY